MNMKALKDDRAPWGVIIAVFLVAFALWVFIGLPLYVRALIIIKEFWFP
jgi:hypothetical protein